MNKTISVFQPKTMSTINNTNISSTSSSRSYALGLLFILIGAILWSVTAIIVQYLYIQYGFNSPFLITYVGCSLFILLIPSNLKNEMQIITKEEQQHRNEVEDLIMEEQKDDHHQQDEFNNDIVAVNESSTLNHAINQIFKKYIPAAFKVLPMWYLSNYFYNFSLSATSITSSTIISNMGCVFTFIFALIFGEEKYSTRRFIGVVLAFMGSVLTSLHDADGQSSSSSSSSSLSNADYATRSRMLDEMNDNDKLLGDFYGFLSALGHAGYTIVVRKVTPTDGHMSMSLLLGFIGLINLILLCPFAIYTLTGRKNTIFVPSDTTSGSNTFTWILFGWLLIKGLFGNLLPDYFWGRAIVLTSATVATVGLNIMIPLAFLSDAFVMHREVLSFNSACGALMVIIGFVLVN